MARILVIDDDNSLREVLRFILTDAGHEVQTAESGEEGLSMMANEPDLVFTDIRMSGIDGLEVLRRIQDLDKSSIPPVIVLTAHGTVEQAVQAMNLGAFSYLLKPIAREELKVTAEKALRSHMLERDNVQLRQLLKQKAPDTGLIFKSQSMTKMMQSLQQAATTDATILITGESGTGKELAARACHDLSSRWDQPFVAVNCGAIPAELMESELFGHLKGAFTGATKAAVGRIRAANGGTLFLDEIAELPLPLQPKLLRVLETRQVDPVGGTGPIEADFRLVCATNKDLEAEVSAGRFREDLLYRINVLRLSIPPLRKRPEDVELLWDHFTRLHLGSDRTSDPELITALLARPWRGNVRELKNLNQRLALLGGSESITLDDLHRLAPESPLEAAPVTSVNLDRPPEFNSTLPLGDLPHEGVSLIELEKEVIRRALAMCGDNRSKAAIFLGIPRHVLVYRIKKHGL